MSRRMNPNARPAPGSLGKATAPKCAAGSPHRVSTTDGEPGADRAFSDRFWSHVARGGSCWEWTRSKVRGYGVVGLGPAGRSLMGSRNATALAHRVAWVLVNGPIPDGLCVLHQCDNRGCVRPGHLWLGTIQDNNADRHRKGRSRGGKTWLGVRGERHPAHKLTSIQVRAITRGLRLGQSRTFLARRFSVTPWTIWAIKAGRRWSVQPERIR